MYRNGEPAGWLITFAREVVKNVTHAFGPIGFLADAILLVIDATEHRSLADRVADTVVVRN
jgi:uncharacterized RDD family membrane protein YckC